MQRRCRAVVGGFRRDPECDVAVGLTCDVAITRSCARGEPLYFESQVERPEIVVAQFIVESDGLADTTAIKLFYTDGTPGPVRVQREIAALLASVRFTPPMVGGQAVNQLAQWRVERSWK